MLRKMAGCIHFLSIAFHFNAQKMDAVLVVKLKRIALLFNAQKMDAIFLVEPNRVAG